MNEAEVLTIFNEVGTIITGHYIFTSGMHGKTYVNKDAIYPYTAKVSRLCLSLAGEFTSSKVDTIVAPAIGAIVLSQWTAHHLSGLIGREILAAYAEKDEDGFMAINRGYDKLVTGKNVLVVEDVLNTGGSARRVVEAVRAIGGNVVGVGALCNRGGVTVEMIGDVPKLISLTNLNFEKWERDDCPLCKQNIPINEYFGKGCKFA